VKILYLADGGSIHTKRWLAYFAKQGHEVHLITDKPSDLEGVTLHVLPKADNVYLKLFKGYRYTRSIISNLAPDIVHAHYLTLYGWLAAFSGFHPFILTVWGSDVLVAPHESWIKRYLTGYVLRRADVVTSDGEHLRVPLKGFGLEMGKLQMIYFGVDTQRFRPVTKGEKGRELGLSESQVVISVRNLEPIYDVATLVRASPLILKEAPGTIFLVMGKGSQDALLKDLAMSLGVEKHFRFTGALPPEVLPEYLAAADVYVSTSLSDAGLAASTAEAMACGLPVVVTDNGDNRKWIEDGVNGFIIPQQNPESLAAKVLIMLKDENLRIEFGIKNRKVIETKNDYYKEMEKVERIYSNLASEDKA